MTDKTRSTSEQQPDSTTQLNEFSTTLRCRVFGCKERTSEYRTTVVERFNLNHSVHEAKAKETYCKRAGCYRTEIEYYYLD